MSDKRRRKELKRRKRAEQKRRSVQTVDTRFLDAVDSYRDEFTRLIEKPPVPDVVGVFPIDEDLYYGTNDVERLQAVGLSEFEMIYYESEFEVDRKANPESIATGCASALRCPDGKIRPVVFVRREVKGGHQDSANEDSAEADAGIRVLVLLHELGHADDIAKGLNFDHLELRIDVVSAEVYAHKYVLEQALQRNYRLALQYYLQEIEEQQAKSTNDPVRFAAQRLMEEVDFEAAKSWSERVWNTIPNGHEWKLAEKRMEMRILAGQIP